MSVTKGDIKRDYPLPVYNYRVTIETLTMGFSEISGLSVEYEPVIYKHGMSFATGTKIIPGMRQPVKLTMKRGVGTHNTYLYQWLRDTYSSSFKSTRRDIRIDLCDESSTPIVSWKVVGAVPVKIDAPAFDANSNEVAIESIEIIAQDMQVIFSEKG